MILYGSSLSPFVRKTLAFAAEKGIQLELKPMPLGGSGDFKRISPFGKMPGFQDGDFVISDSTAIITYLDAKHPQPTLIPAEPAERARTIWYEEFADTILIATMGKMFFNKIVAPRFLGREGDLEAAAAAERDELPPLLDYIEGVLPASGYLVGDRLTLADLAVASPFVNMMHVGFTVDPASHPKTAAFVNRMLARPSFAPWVEQEKAILAA
ncbi:MAG TPA: glutathione S-transferase family protein [Caulobacteraceae bacterium]|nr:glutathione S-transferase family protein [Caulobacteraceae bacterium]